MATGLAVAAAKGGLTAVELEIELGDCYTTQKLLVYLGNDSVP